MKENKTRRKHYRLYVIVSAISIVLFVTCVLLLQSDFLCCGKSKDLVYLISLIGILSFAFFTIFGLLNILLVRRINKWLRNLPYGFDFEKEFSRWKNTGANKTRSGKLKEYSIKNWPGNYTEWKNQVLSDLVDDQKKSYNGENYYHYLVRKLRTRADEIRVVEILMIPFALIVPDIVFKYVDCDNEYPELKIAALIVLYGVLIFAMGIHYFRQRDVLTFLRDYTEVLFGEEKGKEIENEIR